MNSSPQNIGCHITLGEIATYINGYAFKPSDYSSKEGDSIIRIQDLTGNSYETNKFSGSLPEKYRVNNGDILISWSASLGVYEWTKGPAWLNQHIFKVVFDKKPINKSFFIHQARHIIDNSGNLAHGATMRHLTKKVFDALPFYYPNPQEQQQIAAHLDELSAIIDSCQTANRKLDYLVKSRFIEMFGDSSHWNELSMEHIGDKRAKLGEMCDVLNGYAFDSKLFNSESKGMPLIRIRDIKRGATSTYTTEDYSNQYLINNGDLLIGMDGEFNVARWKAKSALLNQRVCRIRPQSLNLTDAYLEHLLPKILKSIEARTSFVTVKHLSSKTLKAIEIPLPPLALQQEFAAFVAQVDKLRFATQQQIDKLEMLKKSLMQEYFG